MIAIGLLLLGYSAYLATTSPLGQTLVDSMDFLHWRNALGLLLTMTGAVMLSPFSPQTESRVRRHRRRADPRLTGRQEGELESFLDEEGSVPDDPARGQSF